MPQLETTLKHYLNQWDFYFSTKISPEEMLIRLQEDALNGKLRSCNFRGVCWRVFLKCLPTDVGLWEDCILQSRSTYDKIKTFHITNPRLEAEKNDLQMDNPLSQSDHSSWQKYFKNNELIAMISRDVRRTFPEMEYFHNTKVREMMVDILFCYAREHQDLSYRQGMHELLAPLLFIIHCDMQAACHASEIGELYSLLKIVLNEDYLEHDAYSMFCRLMEATNSWYSMTEKPKEPEEVTDTPKDNIPFQQSAYNIRNGQSLAITNKLNHIHNTLLSQHDIELYTYLNRLEIIPQVYGLRWIRLLFGREFCLQDLLVLWDAIFADNCSLDLVDYIFVAMLIHIRQKLLGGDYSICMQLLMKFPPIEDINDLVTMAKSIRKCKVGSIKHPNKSQPVKPKTSLRNNQQQSGSQNKLSKFFSDISKQVNDISISKRTKSNPKLNEINSLRNPVHSPTEENSILPISAVKHAPLPKEMLSNVQNTSMENHILLLQRELENYRQMCAYCADKIDSSVRILQPEIKGMEVAREPNNKMDGDVVEEKSSQQNLVAVASLKQVRDILRGTLNFSLNVNSKPQTIVSPTKTKPVTDTPPSPTITSNMANVTPNKDISNST